VAAEALREDRVPLAVWAGFGMMCLGMFMAILDIQVVATSLPMIQGALRIAPDQMSWVQTVYLIAEVIAIPLTGLFTRALSMRWLFVAAIAVFTLASAGCAASDGFAALVGWRILQGLAGGTLIPAVFSAVFLLFPERLHPVATTFAGIVAVLAPTLGPVVGGWVTETYSWHWLFLINVAPGVLAVATAGFLIPPGRPEWRHLRRLDGLSTILLAVALATLEIGLKEAPDRGWLSPIALLLFATTLAAGTLFIRRTVRAQDPVVDLRTLTDRRFAIGCTLSFLLGIGLFGSVYLMPVFLAFVRGHGSLRIGETMLVTGIAQLITAPVAVFFLERRLDERLLTALGFAAFGAGCAMSAFDTRDTDFAGMFWPQVLRGSAIMFCILPPTRLALGHLLPERIPDASGLFNLTRNLGGAIGLALIDTVLYGRAPMHAEALLMRLQAGDAGAAIAVGLPPELVAAQAGRALDAMALAIIRPLVEKAAFVHAVNESWGLLAALIVLGLVSLPFLRVGQGH
jgi:MFS transporter, DHA2 family, multidrug resistance protein